MVRPLLGERLASPAGHEAGVAEAAPRPLPRCDLEPGQGGPRPFAHAAPVEATDCGVAWSLIRARAGKPLPGDLDLEPGAFELGDLIAVQRERRGRATCSARARRSSGSTAPGRVAAEQVPGLEPRDVVVDVAARAETPACASAAPCAERAARRPDTTQPTSRSTDYIDGTTRSSAVITGIRAHGLPRWPTPRRTETPTTPANS